jgi:spermidine synthase
MSVDGVEIGGTGSTDFKQHLLAHLPKLLSENVSVELSVGLGSGILVGESGRHQGVGEIVCVEIEPSVVDGAALFAKESHGVLRDPRLRIVVDDIGNHLRTTPDLYQVVSADEKTAQEYASNGFSYSREYYDLLRSHLAPGGMVVQWVPTTLPPGQYAMILKTFTATFPHALLWYFSPALTKGGSNNTILVGSNDRIEPDYARMRRRLASEPRAFQGLARYGLTTAEAVLAHFIADGDTIRKAVSNAPENSLDHPRYEFFSPRDYAVPREERLVINLDFLMGLRQEAMPTFLAEMATGADDTLRLKQAFAAEEKYLDAYRQSFAAVPQAEVLRRFDSALALAPWNDSLRTRVFLHYWTVASRTYNSGDLRAAVNLMHRALSLYGRSAMARVEYGIMLLAMGETERAVEQTRIAVGLEPRLVIARGVLAQALARSGRRREAAEQLRALLQIEPDYPEAREALSFL